MQRKQRPPARAAWLLAAASTGLPAWAQVDQFQVVVDKNNAALNGAGTAVNSLGAVGYDPSTDTAYASTFNAGLAMRKITGVGTTPVSTVQFSESQLQQYLRDGNPDRAVLTPIISGIVLNPLPVGSFPAYSFAIITDIGTTRLPGSTTNDPAATKRLYRYNLQAVGAAGNPAPPYGDARDVLTTLVTLSDLNAAKGAASTNTSSNFGRQGAFSTDGQSYYSIDSATALGGVYKTNVLTGATSLILNTSGINTEPGVLPRAGGGDRILFQGTAAANNVGGVSFVENNAGTTSAEQVYLSAAALGDFLEKPAAAGDVRAITTDAAGNVYFYDTASRVLVRRDNQGRLSKLATQNERTAFRDQIGSSGTVNGNMLRLQTRAVTHATAGALTQVLYTEQTAQNYLAGVYAFAAGDFDRDGGIDAADIALFKPVLTTRGVVQTNAANFKYDVNGNAIVDWKDVKLLQPFFDFGDGDVNINGIVDFGDFQILQNNFGTAGKTFIQGDLDGDNDVDFGDFQILQNGFGYRSTVLGLGATEVPFDAAAWNAFTAAVPEPSALAVLGLVSTGLLARRRRSSSISHY